MKPQYVAQADYSMNSGFCEMILLPLWTSDSHKMSFLFIPGVIPHIHKSLIGKKGQQKTT